MVNRQRLPELIEKYGWMDIPQSIITREGKAVDTSNEVWNLPYSLNPAAKVDFSLVTSDVLRWVLKSYVIDNVKRTSTHAGLATFRAVNNELLSFATDFGITELETSEHKLIDLFESKIAEARDNHRLWALYRPIQWYIYCAENYAELGFNSAYALELEGMSIPGNPKGEAVRMEDPEKGPLDRTLELSQLIAALKDDTSDEFEHLQQKVALALSISFGRNPANLTFLREEDFIDLTPDSEQSCFILKMPRIKKRQINPRSDFLDEYVDPLYASYIKQLIEKNRAQNIYFRINGQKIPNPGPLFLNLNGNNAAIDSRDFENAYNLTSGNITSLLKAFVARHNIVSPITNKLLHLTTRRLRYTLAVGLAAEGISKRELARILDHSDTQHVLVYFEMAGKIVSHLDKASAHKFASYVNFFKGKIIDNDDEAINGERPDKHVIFIDEGKPEDDEDIGVCGKSDICHLDPPYSCYLCAKFQPYSHANHDNVLHSLLESRDKRLKKYENARLGIQLDDVIAAVASVIKLCEKKEAGDD
ncbi:MAG: site-specific integrase [Thalassotalea sp.]|nr:site-specific integrase [Thalassotalea sp.]